jgi:hypothetical protein
VCIEYRKSGPLSESAFSIGYFFLGFAFGFDFGLALFTGRPFVSATGAANAGTASAL